MQGCPEFILSLIELIHLHRHPVVEQGTDGTGDGQGTGQEEMHFAHSVIHQSIFQGLQLQEYPRQLGLRQPTGPVDLNQLDRLTQAGAERLDR